MLNSRRLLNMSCSAFCYMPQSMLGTVSYDASFLCLCHPSAQKLFFDSLLFSTLPYMVLERHHPPRDTRQLYLFVGQYVYLEFRSTSLTPGSRLNMLLDICGESCNPHPHSHSHLVKHHTRLQNCGLDTVLVHAALGIY